MAGFIQASDGTCWGWVSKETDTIATWMSLASLSGSHLWTSVRGPEKTRCPPEGWVCHIVSFLNWTPFLPAHPCSVLDLTWASLAFAGTARHLPPWIVTDFTSSILLLPWGGGRGSAHHLLILTVPDTSIRGCLSAIANSPITILLSTPEMDYWDLIVLEIEVKKWLFFKIWIVIGHNVHYKVMRCHS